MGKTDMKRNSGGASKVVGSKKPVKADQKSNKDRSKFAKNEKKKQNADKKQEKPNQDESEISESIKLLKTRKFADDLNEYLQMWKVRDQGGNWKFNKVLQAWALENCFNKDKIDAKLFKELIPYILTVKGAALDRLSKDALEIINKKIDSEETGADGLESQPNLKRALKIHQYLTEV